MLKTDRLTQKHLLPFILLVAVIVRLPVAFFMGDQVTELPGIHDQISYDALAQSLLAGDGYQFTEDWYPFTPAHTPTAHWSFVYPLFLAGTYLLTGYHPLVARLFQGIVGGVLICLLVHRIGRCVAGERAGVIGAGLAAVYGYFIYYSVALMTETFFIVMVLATLLIGLKLKDRPSLAHWIWLGLSLGITTLLRQSILPFVPFLLLWLFWELRDRMRLWHVLLSIGTIVLLIIPWTIRNYQVYHRFLPLNSNAGYVLYASNHPVLGNDWRYERGLVPVPDVYVDRNEAEINQALTREGIRFLLQDPVRSGVLTLDKALEYFKFWPSPQSGLFSNIVRVLSFGLYLPFMLLGLLLSLSHWRSYLPLYLFIVLHTGIHLLSWPAIRYRLPVDAIFMIFAGLAVLEVTKRMKGWKQSRLYADGI